MLQRSINGCAIAGTMTDAPTRTVVAEGGVVIHPACSGIRRDDPGGYPEQHEGRFRSCRTVPNITALSPRDFGEEAKKKGISALPVKGKGRLLTRSIRHGSHSLCLLNHPANIFQCWFFIYSFV